MLPLSNDSLFVSAYSSSLEPQQMMNLVYPLSFIPILSAHAMLQNFKSFVTEILQRRILPFYKMPYLYQIDNRMIHLDSLKVKRPNHGCMHISRSIFFAEMMRHIYTKFLRTDPERMDCFAIRHAIAYHDIARNGEGVDVWEKESACFAKNDLTELYDSQLKEEYKDYVSNIIDKAYSHEHLKDDCNQLIVHASDTIEILRFVDLCDFKGDLFHFLSADRDPLAREAIEKGIISLEALNALREQFINEAYDWIEATNSYKIRKKLESSPNYFEDLMRMFDEKKEKLSLKLFSSLSVHFWDS